LKNNVNAKFMRRFVKKYSLVIIFSMAGGVTGFFYWKFVGCLSGTCIIKSVWYWSTLYGLVLGYLTGGLVDEIVLKVKGRLKV
jgi:hypothetical protein